MIIHQLEQNSDEWGKMRCSIPTAAKASKLITSKGEPSKSLHAYAMELAGNLYAGEDVAAWEGNIYTERGLEIESSARLAYEFTNNVSVDEVGFVSDDKQTYGCSPDGLVGAEGLVEFKCLPKNHIKALLYYHKYKNTPPEYYPQCQMQLFVCERAWNDLMFYQDHLPHLTIRIFRNEVFIEKLEEQIVTVLKERDRIFWILSENFN